MANAVYSLPEYKIRNKVIAKALKVEAHLVKRMVHFSETGHLLERIANNLFDLATFKFWILKS